MAGDPETRNCTNPWTGYPVCQNCAAKDAELAQLRHLIEQYRTMLESMTPVVIKAFDVITKERK